MGCNNSAPVKDMVPEKVSGFLTKSAGSGKIKKTMDDTITDISNLDLKKAQQDIEQMGEGLKEAIQDGFDELKENLNPGDNENGISLSPEPDDNKQVNSQSSPSSPTPNESEENRETQTTEEPETQTEEPDPENADGNTSPSLKTDGIKSNSEEEENSDEVLVLP